MKITTTQSAEETRNFGQKIGESLKGGEVLALFGDLGSGKTTLSQGLIHFLTQKNRILSPTFNIVRHYHITKEGVPAKNLYHLDLYRLKSPTDVKNLGVWESIGWPDSIFVIEWPEIVESLLPPSTIKVKFETVDETIRSISTNTKDGFLPAQE
jgi:tRNA threonylcarbamoyladenosine biosynthesis protein TsaE